jgi:RimJ/RimL family protein N-acetyltransferase
VQLLLERGTVRPWRFDDAESLAKHANNRRIWLGLRDLFPHPYTLDDAKAIPPARNECAADNRLLHRDRWVRRGRSRNSLRVLAKAGFVLEGRLKKNAIKDGQILDSLLYAKTK